MDKLSLLGLLAEIKCGKMDTLDFIKIKNFFTSMDPINKEKKTTHRMGEYICKSNIW